MRQRWGAFCGVVVGAAASAAVLRLRDPERGLVTGRAPRAGDAQGLVRIEEARQEPQPQDEPALEEDPGREAGIAVLQLLSTMNEWVHRRVESVEFRDDKTIMRRVSLDLCLPGHAPKRVLPGEGIVRLVPLTWIDKRFRLKSFHVQDESGTSLSLITTNARAEILTNGMKDFAAVAVKPELNESGVDELRRMITDDDPEEAEQLFSFWRQRPPDTAQYQLAHHRTFKPTLGRLIRNTVAIVLLDDRPEQQRIIKYVYEDPFRYTPMKRFNLGGGTPVSAQEQAAERPAAAGHRGGADGWEPQDGQPTLWERLRVLLDWAPRVANLKAPALQDTRSYHVEVIAPPGVKIPGAVLHKEVLAHLPTSEWGPHYDIDRDGESRAHMIMRDRPDRPDRSDRPGTRGRVVVALLPNPNEFYLALFAALFIAVVMLAGAIWVQASFSGEPATVQGHTETGIAVATLLLVLPAVFATLLVRTSEHAMAQFLLRGIRRQLIVSGVLVYAAAATLLIGPSGPALTRTWWALTSISLLLVALIAVGFPIKQRAVRKFLEGIEQDLRETALLLRLKGVGKRYGLVRALQDVRLEVRSGQVLALVGDNGAGKSTLIRVMSGCLPVDEGEVLFDGQPLRVSSLRAAAELGIAAVHQDLGLANNLDVVANLFLGRETTTARMLKEVHMERNAGETMARVWSRVPGVRLHAGMLSGGERQAVAISRLDVREPRLVLLDEPTSALSSARIDEVRKRIEKFRDHDVGVVLASHSLDIVFAVADQIAVLRQGKLVNICDTKETSREEIIAAMMGQAPEPDA